MEIGKAERKRLGIPPPGAERALAATEHVLESRGYEPFRDDRGCVHLRSCPFHELAERDRDLVCSLNGRLIEGIVRGLGNEKINVRVEPATEECCVVLEPPAR